MSYYSPEAKGIDVPAIHAASVCHQQNGALVREDGLWVAKALNRPSQVLAIIPARGGSKGIPRKNIQPLCGKPLLGYAVEVALAAPNIDAVVVSTEDPEVAEVARDCGAEVPFLRPAEIAGDGAQISACVEYTRQTLRQMGRDFDAVVTLYPTSIFRTVSLVTGLTDILLHGYSTVVTAKKIQAGHGGFYSLEKGRLRALPDKRQGTTAGFLRSVGGFLGNNYTQYRSQRRYVRVLEDPIETLDIDNWKDLYLAEEIIHQGLFNFMQ